MGNTHTGIYNWKTRVHLNLLTRLKESTTQNCKHSEDHLYSVVKTKPNGGGSCLGGKQTTVGSCDFLFMNASAFVLEWISASPLTLP